jgi:hypothetical protein
VSWSEVFLAVIALATLIMAVIQIGAIVATAKIARQAQQTLATVQQDIRPLINDVGPRVTALLNDVTPLVARANEVAEEASKTAALATAQAQKVDKLVTDLSQRVDYTAGIVQEAIIRPAREGIALVAAVKATLGALSRARDMRPRHRRPAEEEDPLFIG